ncbi:MAG: 50S ribosomal protein L25 [Blautia sp.]|jgi:large subunit ribosomal protein L25
MTTLKAVKRDMNVKAKALRRQGKITGNVYGKDMTESIPIQFSAKETKQFLNTHTKGSQAILDLEGQKINVLLKDVTYDPMSRQYYNIDFQMLVEGEKVISSVPILLLNPENAVGFLTHHLSEISYKAMPSALIEKVEIDVGKLKAGTILTVGDLDMAKNERIELITPPDTLILHMSEYHGYTKASEEETDENA